MTTIRSRALLLASASAIGLAASLVLPAAAQAETTYTFADVQKHATRSDCWSIVNGGVYNLTTWVDRHEGGPTVIVAMCGLDGTASFTGAHGAGVGRDAGDAARALSRLRIGVLDPTSVPTAQSASYTMEQVATHAVASDCWSVVNGKVYNLTNWVNKHPGGAPVITAMCGADGTASYQGQHKGSSSAAAYLAQFVIGTLTGGSTTTTPATSYTLAQVATHKSTTDCWSVVNGGVYDLTKWIGKHPGGPGVIEAMCGVDGTAAYNGQHKGSSSAASYLGQYKIGTLSGVAPTTTAAKTYTMAQVRRHNTSARCWSVVNGKVYNLTKWIAKHPGGKANIKAMCGRNGTKAFTTAHGRQASIAAILKGYKIGRVA
jgi:cytochrome b involved in lipid metabolism